MCFPIFESYDFMGNFLCKKIGPLPQKQQPDDWPGLSWKCGEKTWKFGVTPGRLLLVLLLSAAVKKCRRFLRSHLHFSDELFTAQLIQKPLLQFSHTLLKIQQKIEGAWGVPNKLDYAMMHAIMGRNFPIFVFCTFYEEGGGGGDVTKSSLSQKKRLPFSR